MQLKYLHCKQSLLTVESNRGWIKNIIIQHIPNHTKPGKTQNRNQYKKKTELDRNEGSGT